MTQDDTRAITVISADPIESPNGLYEQAMCLRYSGTNCKEIAAKLQLSHGTVRNWFAKGGLLEKQYEAFKISQRPKVQESRESIQEEIRQESIAAFQRTAKRAVVHEDNPLGQRADEKLMEIGGLTAGGFLIAQLQRLTYEEARDKINQVFLDVFGKPFEQKADFHLTPELVKRFIELQEKNLEIRTSPA